MAALEDDVTPVPDATVLASVESSVPHAAEAAVSATARRRLRVAR